MAYQIATAGATPAYLKIIVTGPSGAGKTRFGIDGGSYKITKDGKLEGAGELWPDLIVVNAERGASAYEEAFEGMYSVVNTKKITDLNDLIDDIIAGKVKCGTLLVDTWTTFRNTVMNAVDKTKRGDEMSFKEFGKVNKALEAVQDKLENMPCHVILVVHETEVINTEMSEQGKAMAAKKAARNAAQADFVKMEANKKVARWADFTLWFEPKQSANATTRARVHKTRGVDLGEDKDGYISNPSYAKTFKAIAERWAKRGTHAETLRQDEAERDAANFADELDKPANVEALKPVEPSKHTPAKTFADTNATKRWVVPWTREPYNLTYEQILSVLGAENFSAESLKLLTFTQADELLKAAYFTQSVNE